jgi:hypothetical protein
MVAPDSYRVIPVCDGYVMPACPVVMLDFMALLILFMTKAIFFPLKSL